MDLAVATARSTWPGRDYFPALAIFALATLWPVAWITWDWATLTGYYEESLGFRYFYSLRTVYEPERYLFLAQGHLVTFSHELLQLALDLFLPPVPLQPRIDVFARLAILVGHGLSLCALAWALRVPTFDGQRILIASLWALLYYIDGWDGYYVLLSPDYHTWIPATGILFTGLLARAREDRGQLPVVRYLQLGAFGAFAVGVKITLGTLALVASIYFLLVDHPIALARKRLLLSLLGGLLLAILILGLNSWGRFDIIPVYALRFAYFLVSAGPIDAISIDRIQSLIVSGRAWAPLAIALLPCLMLAMMLHARGGKERSLPAALLVGALLYVYFIVKRLTPITLFEAGVFLAVATSLSTNIVARRLPFARLIAVSALSGVLALSSGHRTLWLAISNLNTNTVAQSRLQEILAGIHGRIAFLIPTNQYQFLSLEGALFKGTSDLETRRDVEGSPFSAWLLGNREFLFGEAPRYDGSPPSPSDYAAVVFSLPRAGQTASDAATGVEPRFLELQRNYNMALEGFSCTDRVDFGDRLAVVCRPGNYSRRKQ